MNPENLPDVSLRLEWRPVPKSLPPDDSEHAPGWFSPRVWFALSDGRVVSGTCLHNKPGIPSGGRVHSWFYETERDVCLQLEDGVDVIAWMPFAVPDHPFPNMRKALIADRGPVARIAAK